VLERLDAAGHEGGHRVLGRVVGGEQGQLVLREGGDDPDLVRREPPQRLVGTRPQK
jgi:hypothetical protein